ncbi:ATP-binding cassette domain-containing protein [Streptosporangium sp. NPDC000396]|uniref:ATP-binding cassette domain-containing protein n=1 Tax=Streptosporangium sp. NPDC000396 TaxID=3366185 RepID=UPI0036BC8E2E
MTDHVIVARDLRRSEGRGVSFAVRRGEVFGLFGAGAATTIRMLATLLAPAGGTARVCGYDVVEQRRQVRRCIGSVSGGRLWSALSAADNLRFFAELYGVPPRDRRDRIEEALDLVGLSGGEGAGAWSPQSRVRLRVASSLLRSPEALFVDEPSIEIGPAVSAIAARGTTVVLTTRDAARCDRVAVFAGGGLVELGPPAGLSTPAGLGTPIEPGTPAELGTPSEPGMPAGLDRSAARRAAGGHDSQGVAA